MKRLSRGLAIFLPLLWIGLVQAHPTGTSKVSIEILDPGTITVAIDVNHADIMNVTKDILQPDTLSLPQAQLFQEKTSNYLLSRVILQVDGQPQSLKILRWKPNGKGPEDGFYHDDAAFGSMDNIITYAGTLPPQSRKKLDVTVQLFAEFGIEPISEVSLYWHDTLLVRHWLGLDRTLHLYISPDSLTALIQQTRQPPSVQAAHQENLILRFIGLGYTHILPEGLDHILFVLGLFFFSTRMKPLLWQITAFTVAHSVTLGLAMSGVFSLPSSIVEPLIALSIAIIGLENIFFRKVKASRWMVVFAFGLIHGMGFASALRGLGLPPGKFWPVLASFNGGVELGQLTIVTAAFLLTRWMWHKPWYFKRVVVPVSSVITIVALYWFVQRVTGF